MSVENAYVGRKDALAHELYAEYQSGLTLAQIAEKHGRAKGGICRLFQRRGWPTRRGVDPFAGLPPKDVGRIIDVSRFWSKVKAEGDGSYKQCWLWTGGTNGKGYGRFKLDSRSGGTAYAHRIAYELLIAPIPEGLEIDHLCRATLCVNPWHLEPVSHEVNTQRSTAGALAGARKSAITHCPQGHEYTPSNTYRSKNPKTGGPRRACRQCSMDRARIKRESRIQSDVIR